MGSSMSYPDEHFRLHQYPSYEAYRDTQVFHNKRKLSEIWADERTLGMVADRIEREFGSAPRLFGLCHGTRNGFEQNWLAERLNAEVLGTDISDTAATFPRSVQWDFHDPNPEWTGRCDFVYTNSWDQSWKPRDAMETWLDQAKIGGLVFVEHTELHGPQGQSEMDPFGATPEFAPYLLCDWFGHRIAVEILHGVKPNKKDRKVWVFVVKRVG